MKTTTSVDQAGSKSPGADASPRITKRRGLLLGAGVAGAAVVAAKAFPGASTQAVAATPTEPISDTSGGYRLSQHVLRYYETTKV